MVSIKTSYTDGARRGFYKLGVLRAGRGVTPDVLTGAGVALSMVVAGFIVSGHFLWAAVTLLVASVCDALDGAVARAGRGPTRSGAFLDSTLDRVSEITGAFMYAPNVSVTGTSLLVGFGLPPTTAEMNAFQPTMIPM